MRAERVKSSAADAERRYVTTAIDTPDVLASWRGWALAAEGADEPDLALRLWSTAPRDAVPWWEAELGCVRALLVLGRFPEALTRVRALADQVGRTTGDPLDLMLAAAFAASGDDAAYDYLLGAARAPQLSMPAAALLRVVGSVAEHRGRVRDAAWAWTFLVEQLGVTSRAVTAAYAAAVIGARTPDADAQTLVALMRGAQTALERLEPPPRTDPAPVLDAVARLRRRGDTAGARLLLGAVEAATPGIRALRPVRRAVTPTGRMLLLGTVAVVLALALGIGLTFLRGVTGSVRATGGVVLALAASAWGRTVRLPGLSRAESEAYRLVVRGDPLKGGSLGPPGPATTSDGVRRHTGIWMVGGVLGVISGCAVAITLTMGDGPFSEPEDFQAVGGLIWASATIGLGGLGFAAFRAMDLGIGRRRLTSRIATLRAAAADEAGRCVCGAQAARVGQAATDYLERHLAPANGGYSLPATIAGGQVRRCVATRATWLTGTLGDGERPVALNGYTRV